MTWYETSVGNYINSDQIVAIGPDLVGSDWMIRVNSPNVGILNCGPYLTENDAREAVRKLVAGVDPSTIV